MNLTYKTSINKMLLMIMLLLSGFVMYTTNSPLVQVYAFVIQYLLTIFLLKTDFINPLFWFLGGLTIYSIGYPLLYIADVETIVQLTTEPLKWSWLAYFIFVISFRSTNAVCKFHVDCNMIDKSFIKKFIYISGLFVLVSVLLIADSGYANKGEIYSDGNLYISMAFYIIYVIHTIYVWIMQLNYIEGESNYYLIVYIGIISLLMTMYSGERDILFRFMIITVCSLYLQKSISNKMLFCFFSFFIILIPLSRMMKYYFLTADSVAMNFYESPELLFLGIIGGEFESASKNLQILANDEGNSMYALYGLSYLSAITRIFGYAPYSAIEWFNNKYYFGSLVGHGFTIVGEGYVNFGMAGIVFNFIVIGKIMSYLYNNRFKNTILATIYICMIPTMIYVMRADFSNLLSPLFKQIIVPLILMNWCVRKRKRGV